jgi:hypothetical protein
VRQHSLDAGGDGEARVILGGQALAGVDEVTVLVDEDEVGEGAADVDADANASTLGGGLDGPPPKPPPGRIAPAKPALEQRREPTRRRLPQTSPC